MIEAKRFTGRESNFTGKLTDIKQIIQKDVAVKISFTFTLKKWNGSLRTGLILLRLGIHGYSHGHCNETSGSIKIVKFLD
jgi:hypothetical protein